MALTSSGFDLRRGDRSVDAQIINTTGDQVLHGGLATAIRDMRRGDADPGIEKSASEMRGRPRAGGCELHLVLIDFSVSNEFREVIDRQILPNHQHERQIGYQGDRREAGQCVVRRFL